MKRAKAPVVFADTKQEQAFVLHFGRKRPVGKIIIRTALNDEPRIPREVNIHGSNNGLAGPWTPLVEKGDMRCRNGYMLDNREFRWLRFSFGESVNGLGCRIKELRIYKRYYNPPLAELMKAFYPKFRRDVSGLEEFWKKIDTQDWAGAASALRAYEEKRYEQSANPPQYQINADLALDDKIDFGNNVIVKPHTYDQHFHFRDGTDAIPMPNGIVRSDFEQGGNLMLIPLEPDRLSGSAKTSTPVNYDGMLAPTMYGWKYILQDAGHQRLVTVLYPYSGNKPIRVSVKKLDAPPDVAALEVTTPSGRDVIYVSDTVNDHVYSRAVKARARVFVARLDTDGSPIRVSGLDVEEIRAGKYHCAPDGSARGSVEAEVRGHVSRRR